MRDKIKKWWNTKDEKRFTKGTSQDMVRTNGDVVIGFIIFIIIAISIVYTTINGQQQ